MSCFLYILRSQLKETYYIGISANPDKRLWFHNTDDRNAYTKRHRPWELVYKHEFNSKERALAAERKVKSWKSKKMICSLIAGEIDVEDFL